MTINIHAAPNNMTVAELRALAYLDAGPLTRDELAEKLGCDIMAIPRLLLLLQKRGLIFVGPSIHLLRKGSELISKLHAWEVAA